MSNNTYYLSSIFDSAVLNEGVSTNDSRVDGENIIGKVEGTFFVPGGFSRNKRYYPKNLWEKVLADPETQRRLADNTIFGCIGHSTGPVTETDLSSGKVSHFMDKLWIDESTGMGKGVAYILNTDAGRNLKTYLKAGCKLKVSSRGEGSFLEGKTENGQPIVDPESYGFKCFDIVIEPGFTEVDPQITEGYIEESLKEDEVIQIGDSQMNFETLAAEYKSERDSARKELSEAQTSHAVEVAELNSKISALTEELEKAKQINESNDSELAKQLDEAKNLNESYAEFGSVEEIKKASILSESVLSELELYKKQGSIADIKKLMSVNESLRRELKGYKSFGSLDEVKRLSSLVENYVAARNKQELLNTAKTLSEKYEQPIERVSSLMEKLGTSEAEKVLADMQPAKKEEKIDETLEVQDEAKEEIVEEKVEEKEEKAFSISEMLFEEANKRLFINEDEDDEDEIADDEENMLDVEDDEIEIADDEEIEADDDLNARIANMENLIGSLVAAVEKLSGESIAPEEEPSDEIEGDDFQDEFDEE